MKKNNKKCLLTYRRFMSVLKWASFCERNENFKWTKWDENLVSAVKQEIVKQNRVNYLKQKNEKINKLNK